MGETIAVCGRVETPPRHLTTVEGLAVTSFVLCAAEGGERFAVSATSSLAVSAARCLTPGDPVVVAGRLRVSPPASARAEGMAERDVVADEEAPAELEAHAIGHDLAKGRSVFLRQHAAPVRVSP